jgi:hypothetical protein
MVSPRLSLAPARRRSTHSVAFTTKRCPRTCSCSHRGEGGREPPAAGHGTRAAPGVLAVCLLASSNTPWRPKNCRPRSCIWSCLSGVVSWGWGCCWAPAEAKQRCPEPPVVVAAAQCSASRRLPLRLHASSILRKVQVVGVLVCFRSWIVAVYTAHDVSEPPTDRDEW